MITIFPGLSHFYGGGSRYGFGFGIGNGDYGIGDLNGDGISKAYEQ